MFCRVLVCFTGGNEEKSGERGAGCGERREERGERRRAEGVIAGIFMQIGKAERLNS